MEGEGLKIGLEGLGNGRILVSTAPLGALIGMIDRYV